LTFKAVCDTIKSQGHAIRDLERQVQNKANIQEFMTSLSLKANVSDVSRTISDVQAQLDKKFGQEDMQQMMENHVSK
jgi:hypothetical protein